MRVLAWVVNAASLSCLALILAAPLRRGRLGLDLTVYGFLWLLVVTAFTFTMGVAGWLRPLHMAVGSLLVLGAAFAMPSSRRILREEFTRRNEIWMAAGRAWQALPRWLRWFTVAIGVASVIRFSFLILALPPFVWDALTYHLTNVAQWTQYGRIGIFDNPVTRTYTPANYEVLAAWFTVFLRHDAIVEAAGLPAYVLALLSVYSAGRSLGFTREAAWSASLAYGLTPALLLAATGTKNDPHMAAYYLAGVAVLLDLKGEAEPRPKSPPLAGQLIVMAAIFFMALGTKSYALHLLPGALLIAFLPVAKGKGSEVWHSRWTAILKTFRRGGGLLQSGLPVLLALALVLGLYWNLRNWVLTGNPVYPYRVVMGGQELTSGAGSPPIVTGFDRLAENLALLAEKFGDQKAPITPDLPDTTGWGWFAYGIGMPVTIWAVLRRRGIRALALGFAVSLLILSFSNRPSPWNMRYAIWVPALFALAFGGFLDWTGGRRSLVRNPTILLFVVTSVLNLLMTLNYGIITVENFQRMLRRPLWQREAAALKAYVPGEYENALMTVPRSEPLGYNVHGNGFIYPLYRADFSQRLIYLPLKAANSCQEIEDKMRERGLRWLFAAEGHTAHAILERLDRCAQGSAGLMSPMRGVYALR